VHELSIAHSLVGVASETARQYQASRVRTVHLRLGVLAGVAREALEFCYEVATAGTLLEGSELKIHELPVIIHCGECGRDLELPDLAAFRCPECGTLSGDIRQGRELEVESIELDIEENEAGHVDARARDPQGGPQQE
jgi:hydrogenase nickel incorporation protein HypA/HybF